ncbi:hypothetical protein [Streptacidiphilus carbonis]|uniref:hypothetical protein n=1 Tax=Streptacidiphilus carbonis TaxID=105422 RepID=UPI001269D7A9|nr:hypothetical protein [Streptacidiphilus carbonis]
MAEPESLSAPIGTYFGGPGAPLTVDAASYPAGSGGITRDSLSFGDGSAAVDITSTPDLDHWHTYPAPGVYAISTDVTDGIGEHVVATRRVRVGSAFVSMTPTRVLDTRSGTGTPRRRVPANGSVTLKVAGSHGIPANGVTAVVMNVTETDTVGAGYVTAYPSGSALPNASNLNFVAGQTVSNEVTVPVGADGSVVLYSHSAPLDLVADVQGYEQATASVTKGQFLAYGMTVPTRVLDTRSGLGAPARKVTRGGTVSLAMPSGTTAVVLNLTVTDAASAGYVSAYPSGSSRPNVSNVNFAAGQTLANQVTVPVGADGRVVLYSQATAIDLIADVQGYYGSPQQSSGHANFTALTPTRVLDTRNGIGAATGQLQAGGVVRVKVTDPGSDLGICFALLNVTGVDATQSGYLTVYADGTARPTASNLNLVVGRAVPNLVLVPVGSDGYVSIYNPSGDVDVVADLEGISSDML